MVGARALDPVAHGYHGSKKGERETWTTGEFGSSHAGAVGVLLADGTVPGSGGLPQFLR
ncbi:hypothetical protein GTY41_28215 [Streptomyces sp. SID685]|uniref:hypothetical protein n=1 Tax=Streptomyces sp. SID685 TaxID=2690322 RepID=UPI001371D293|nr:hypothetical protein [Streptomyces sp. SID685]MYR88696.1 hypothetical protein [Streptomyces sp. SID685]